MTTIDLRGMKFSCLIGPWYLENHQDVFAYMYSGSRSDPESVEADSQTIDAPASKLLNNGGELINGRLRIFGNFPTNALDFILDFDRSPVSAIHITGDDGSVYKVDDLTGTWYDTFDDNIKNISKLLYHRDNIIYGSNYFDEIESGKGIDEVWGGKGEDWFWVSNKYERGKRNYDIIKDFEVGIDWVGIDGSSRGMKLRNYDGDAWIMKGRHPIAILENAGGSVDWLQEDGTWWVN